jgi:hypothetical protein
VPGFECGTDGYAGDIESSTYGGDGIYSFSVTTSDQTFGFQNETNYTVEVVDSSGCSAIFNYAVNSLPGYSPTVSASITPSCPGSNNGTLEISFGYNGTNPCVPIPFFCDLTDSAGNYLGSDTSGTYFTVTGLAPGTYTVSYGIAPNGYLPTDSQTELLVVPSDTLQVLTVDSIVPAICANANGNDGGAIYLTATGGIPCYPYSYWWSDSSGNSYFTYQPILTNLAPGPYTVTVSYSGFSYCNNNYIEQNNQCIQTASYYVPYPTSYPVPGYEYDTICSGLSYYWQSTNYSQSGTYTATIYGGSVNGCDSTANMVLTVLDPITTPFGVTPQIVGDDCGATFDNYWNTVSGGDGNYTFTDITGTSYCNNGGYDVPYTVYITDGHGCTGQYNTDFILQDDVFDFIAGGYPASCSNSSDGSITGYTVDYTNQECNYNWNLTIVGTSTPFYYSAGGSSVGGTINLTGLAPDTYQYTIMGTNNSGCSQPTNGFIIVSSNNSAVYGYENDTLYCSSASFYWNGNSYSQAGSYTYTLYGGSVYGCDSIDNLNLTVLPAVNGYESDTICSGGSLSWNGSTYSQSGNYTYTISGGSVTGCDSIDNMVLTVLAPITVQNITPQIAGDNCGAAFNDSWNTVIGGDGNYTFVDVPGQPYCNSGGVDVPYIVYITDGHGCTGQYTTDLISEDDVFDFIASGNPTSCPNSSNGSISGYTVDNTNQECVYFWTLTLQGINTGYTTTPTSGSSNGYTINFTGLPADTYQYTIQGSDQCSQATTGYITVSSNNTPVNGYENDTVYCNGASFYWNGTFYSQAGSYTYTLSGGSVYGCDSVDNLNLTVLPAVNGYENATICSGSSYTWNGTSYSQSGTYTYTISGGSVNGCDSTDNLTLAVLTYISGYETQSICSGGSYTWNGNIYAQSGSYADTLAGASVGGCDSIDNLSLTVVPPVYGYESDTACFGGSITWNGTVYNQSGIYSYTLSGGSVSGCDSTDNLNLTVLPALSTTLYDTIANGGSVQIGNQTYTQTGTYTNTLSGTYGCDSVVILNLYVIGNNSYSYIYLLDTICQGGSVTIGNNSYSSGGVYVDTLGGDSIVTLALTISPVYASNLYDTLVTGDTLHLNGNIYTQSGVYTDSLTSVRGCDSIVTLYLLVEPASTFVQLFDTICQGFSITLGGHTYTVSGTYLDTISGTTADTVISLHLTVSQGLLVNTYDTICQGSSVSAGGHTYTQSGIYVDTLSSIHGCDSIRVLHLTVQPLVTPTASITVSAGPQIAGIQIDTFTVSYTDCSDAYLSWFKDIIPLGIHSAVAVVSLPVGEQDSIICQINCQNQCASIQQCDTDKYHHSGSGTRPAPLSESQQRFIHARNIKQYRQRIYDQRYAGKCGRA